MLAWMGGLGVSEYNGIVSPAYCVYRLKRLQIPNLCIIYIKRRCIWLNLRDIQQV